MNEEDRPRAPGRYIVGEPLPEEVVVLPTTLEDEPISAGQGDDGRMADESEGVYPPACPECGADTGAR